MPRLNCKVENCAYNYNKLCKKNYIDVDGPFSKTKDDTCCNSFCDCDDVRNIDTEFATFDKAANIKTEIYCDATNCVYEKGQRCYADHVEILKCKDGHDKQITHCQTFEPIEKN